jgi:hypothetical protein
LLLIIACFVGLPCSSQELFIHSEPASTLPARSVGVNVSANIIPYDPVFARPAQRYTGQFMIGVSNRFSMKLTAAFANIHTTSVEKESFSFYGKYRLLSRDDIHKHFRLAAFLQAAYSYAPFHSEEVDLRDKTGVSTGIIVTRLLNKFALSASASITQLLDSSRFNETAYVPPRIYEAMNYSFSAGCLLFPQEYRDFDQLNVNIYMEFLAQQTLTEHKYYVDFAPGLQFIVKSSLKLNIGYRIELSGDISRLSRYEWLFEVEKNFLNVWKTKSR